MSSILDYRLPVTTTPTPSRCHTDKDLSGYGAPNCDPPYGGGRKVSVEHREEDGRYND